MLAASSVLGLANTDPVRAFRARGWATLTERRQVKQLAYGLARRSEVSKWSAIQQDAYLKLTQQSSLGEPLEAKLAKADR